MLDCCESFKMIDIVGLGDPRIIDLGLNPYWTQTTISETLEIPNKKPDVEQIDLVKLSAKIIRKKVIKTPMSNGDNKEGMKLTGRKLILEGVICQTVQYTADVPEQSVHSAQFSIPFSAFIVIPIQIKDSTGKVIISDTLNANFQINVCIEDVCIKQVCLRDVFENIILFLQAVPTPSEKCGEGTCCKNME